LIRAAIEAGVRVEPIPGPSAAMAALAVSGLPTDTFTFLGFPPVKGSERSRWFEEARASGRTVVFFEAPHRIHQTLQQLLDALGDAEISVGRELTKAHEELVRGPISVVIGALGEPRGEYTVVVDVGHITDIGQRQPPGDREIHAAFGDLTNSGRLTRRGVVSELARRFRIPAREVYAAIERVRNSVE